MYEYLHKGCRCFVALWWAVVVTATAGVCSVVLVDTEFFRRDFVCGCCCWFISFGRQHCYNAQSCCSTLSPVVPSIYPSTSILSALSMLIHSGERQLTFRRH